VHLVRVRERVSHKPFTVQLFCNNYSKSYNYYTNIVRLLDIEFGLSFLDSIHVLQQLYQVSGELTHFDHVIKWHDARQDSMGTLGIDRLYSSLEHNPI